MIHKNDFTGTYNAGNIYTWGDLAETSVENPVGTVICRWGDSLEFVVVGEKIGGEYTSLSRIHDMLFAGMAMNELIGYDLLRSSMRRKGQTDAL